MRSIQTDDQLIADPQRQLSIISPASGKTCVLTEINQGVYTQKLLGEGAVIHITGSELITPLAATVIAIHPARREILLGAQNGLRIYMVLTGAAVDYHGEHIQWQVKTGEQLKQGQLLATLNLPALRLQLGKVHLLVTLLNSDKLTGLRRYSGVVQMAKDVLMTLYI